MKKLLVLLMLVSQVGFAADPDNVFLHKNDLAPYDGIIFPLPRAERVELMTIDLSTCTKRLNLSIQDNEKADERIANFTAEVKTLRDENASKSTFLSQFGMFLLGAGTAVLITYGVHRATQ